jgi:hypothetical protein
VSTAPGSDDPHAEYGRRLTARREHAAREARRERFISTARLIVFLIGAVLAWLSLVQGRFSPAWLALPVIVFALLLVRHERAIRARRLAERAADLYTQGIARLEDRWTGSGIDGTRFVDENHPYAADLDLFGRGSLFELLCTARTRAGEETLASWLTAPSDPETIRARQEAVIELRPRIDLRERLALTGSDVRAALHPEALTAWGRATPGLQSAGIRITAAVLALFNVAALIGWGTTGIGPMPFVALLILSQLFYFTLSRRIGPVIAAVEGAGKDLDVFARLLAIIERESVSGRRLVELRSALDTGGAPPSKRVAQLDRLIDLLDAQRNMMFAPIAWVLLWPIHMAYAIEAWRARTGPALGGWIAAAGEYEALCSLAGYSYEHPSDTFPEIVAGEPCFDGEALGHPLLPASRCVRNDVSMGAKEKLWIVSGSNMSGKSTMLRTIGTSAVLAQAGAPVRARRLALTPLAVGASIRIVDSLQGGSSRFYAEITQLRRIVDLASGERPLLYLLDEILHGTNSHDRRIGAEAVVRALVERGAIGLVTTHDLALARIADELAPRAANVHFEDHLENGKMTFDYRLHPGVVKKSNALELMRAVGLEV